MLIARLCDSGLDAGRWYMVETDAGRSEGRRGGYCARHCAGHATPEEALAHQLKYQLDHELELGLERRSAPSSCEVCGTVTTLRARVASFRPLFVLCWEHQSVVHLRLAIGRRASRSIESAAATAASVALPQG